MRAKEQTHRSVARLVAKRADAVVAVTDQIATEMQEIGHSTRVAVIPNGADFEDFANLRYQREERFRITHTGSFFGKRDPRPFLTALARMGPEVVARFFGDFRRSDLDWVRASGLERRLELIPYGPRQRSLELQRSSDALLLLLPDVGERGRDVPSGKLFEYLAARRPILAAVPPTGTAAQLIQEAGAGIVVAPEDVGSIQQALEQLVDQWRAGELADVSLPPALAERISRRTRTRELSELLQDIR